MRKQCCGLVISSDNTVMQAAATYATQNTQQAWVQVNTSAKVEALFSSEQKGVPTPCDQYNYIILDPAGITPTKMPILKLYKALSVKFCVPIIVLTPQEKPFSEKAYTCLKEAFLVNGGVEAALKGSAQHWAGVCALKTAKNTLYETENKFTDLLRSVVDWAWEVDQTMHVRQILPGRYKVPRVLSEGAKLLNCFLPEEREKAIPMFADLCQNPTPFYDMQYWGVDTKGVRVCWALSGVPVFDAENIFQGYRGVARNVSAAKASEDQLDFLANKDTLTGAYNRSRFYDELKQALRICRQHKNSGGLLLLDIDRFKYMNDTFGHDAGDGLLVHIAHTLRDLVQEKGIIARLGGDEFAVILPEITPKNLEEFAKHITEQINQKPFVYDTREISVSISMGAVVFPQQGRSAGELFSKADIAMYQAKQEGRNRWFLFEDAQLKNKTVSKRLEAVEFINKALEEERFCPHYQPIIPLQDIHKKAGAPMRYEVLCRMVDEEGGLVMPFHFIEAAEDFGLIQRIDEYMCRHGLHFLKTRHALGEDIALSINLSGITFEDTEAMERIRKLVQKAALPQGRVIFEITETTALKDISRAQCTIRSLKSVGCEFALDDFGVGYSSFSYVRHLDVDYVKIDGSFIRQINHNIEDRVFVKALNDVAKGMGIQTIAEMVEDESAENHIRDIGIDYGQGYHFGRPAPHLLGEHS